MADSGVVSHTVLEKEFDRVLMIETDKDPAHYYPACGVVPKMEYAKVIHRAIPLVRTANIYISLKMMKFLTNRMVCDDHGKRRRRIGKVLSVGGKNIGELVEHFMTENPDPRAVKPIQHLEKIYRESIEEAAEYLQELYTLTEADYHLSSRWNRTYNG